MVVGCAVVECAVCLDVLYVVARAVLGQQCVFGSSAGVEFRNRVLGVHASVCACACAWVQQVTATVTAVRARSACGAGRAWVESQTRCVTSQR